MKVLTDKQAYEIIRDNTSWDWVFPEDVKYIHGWIFHRTREDDTMNYHKGKEPIECYPQEGLYSYEFNGCPLEPWSGCDLKDSPFKKNNEHKVLRTLVELNRSYRKHKDDRFIQQVYEIAFTKEDAYFSELKDKYTRDDVLERLMEMSNDSLKVEELAQCK